VLFGKRKEGRDGLITIRSFFDTQLRINIGNLWKPLGDFYDSF
jgi:hypothetical protein